LVQKLTADLVLVNGKIVTLDPQQSIVEAVAVRCGRILAVGSNHQIESLVFPQTDLVDLKGRTVVPGLIDSHCHMISMMTVDRAIGAIFVNSESGVRSIADIQSRIAVDASKKPEDQWVFARGEDESTLAERRHPTKADLDNAVSSHPVLVEHVGGHVSIFNSRALELAGVRRDAPDPVGGRYERDPSTGELTGIVHEQAARDSILPSSAERPSLEKGVESLRWVAEQYVASGLTCISEGWVRDSILIEIAREALRNQQLPIRIRIDPTKDLMSHLAASGIGEGFGNEMLQINAIKAIVDGAVSSGTAALFESYPGRPGYRGELATTKEALRDLVMEGCSKGFRFAVHANGDRAIDMLLDVLEEADAKYPRKDPRHRIIHCTVINDRIIDRIKRSGVLPTIFGPFAYYHGDKLFNSYGPEMLERMMAARSFLDAGIMVSAHSDCSAAPFEPLLGIHSLVNRQSANGKPVGLSQRVSAIDALKMYTINAAYHTFEENIMGSIEPGKYADMVVLGKDLLTVPIDTIKDIPVDMTIVGGRIVYRRLRESKPSNQHDDQ